MDLKTLEKFTDTCREKLKKPFTLKGKTCATNGIIFLRTNEEVDGAIQCPDPSYFDTLESNFDSELQEPQVLTQFRTEEEKETCSECEGTGKVTVCPECDGEGEIELDTGYNLYTVECESCHGRGTISDGTPDEDCEYCEGTGTVSVRKLISIGSSRFDNRLINKLIDNLPEDATISSSKYSHKPAVLKWNGGEGLLMPCVSLLTTVSSARSPSSRASKLW